MPRCRATPIRAMPRCIVIDYEYALMRCRASMPPRQPPRFRGAMALITTALSYVAALMRALPFFFCLSMRTRFFTRRRLIYRLSLPIRQRDAMPACAPPRAMPCRYVDVRCYLRCRRQRRCLLRKIRQFCRCVRRLREMAPCQRDARRHVDAVAAIALR